MAAAFVGSDVYALDFAEALALGPTTAIGFAAFDTLGGSVTIANAFINSGRLYLQKSGLSSPIVRLTYDGTNPTLRSASGERPAAFDVTVPFP